MTKLAGSWDPGSTNSHSNFFQKYKLFAQICKYTVQNRICITNYNTPYNICYLLPKHNIEYRSCCIEYIIIKSYGQIQVQPHVEVPCSSCSSYFRIYYIYYINTMSPAVNRVQMWPKLQTLYKPIQMEPREPTVKITSMFVISLGA